MTRWSFVLHSKDLLFPWGPSDLQSTWPLRPAALSGSTYNLLLAG